MLIVISPSKGQDFASENNYKNTSIPQNLESSQLLIDELKKLNSKAVQNLMQVSKNIADLNVTRFKSFKRPFNQKNSKPALFAFKGDVYSGFSKDKYSNEDLKYAQKHLRILSGLYGALRPMDLIQAYRLEMKTKLNNPRGENLYQFWDTIITDTLNLELAKHQDKTLINLASNEYFKAVKPKLLKGNILNISFKETKNSKTRVIAIFAKRARGLMSDFILRNRIENPEGIKNFKVGGYKFSTNTSDDKNWVFERPQP